MKTLSVKQPHATLICAGVKRVENRTWTTDYRGRLLIHASGDSLAYPSFDYLPKKWQEVISRYIDTDDDGEATAEMFNYEKLVERAYVFYGRDWSAQEPALDWIKGAIKKYGWFMPGQAIIGEAILTDIIQNSDDGFAIPGQYNWIMSEPVLYDKPILKVMGRLRLWDFKKTT
jgi:hypothetical protein